MNDRELFWKFAAILLLLECSGVSLDFYLFPCHRHAHVVVQFTVANTWRITGEIGVI